MRTEKAMKNSLAEMESANDDDKRKCVLGKMKMGVDESCQTIVPSPPKKNKGLCSLINSRNMEIFLFYLLIVLGQFFTKKILHS